MERYTLQFPDTVMPDGFAPVSVSLKSCVNPTAELTPGGVCTALLEVTARAGDGFSLPAGTELTLCRGAEKLGVFIAQKPQKRGGLWHISAYDRLSLLDMELGQWLYELPGWPYTLQDLAELVLEKCGITAVNALPMHGAVPVAAFAASGITGRKLLQWICQAAGCFCRADPEGRLEYGWFTPTDTVIAPTGERFYYADGFTCADYPVTPVQKVQLQLTDTDVGAVYPDDPAMTNAMVITGNYLLTTADASYLEQIAQNLYGRMKDITYTPCKVVTVPVIRPGDIFTVTDTAGVSHTVYAMTCAEKDGVLTVESTGAYRRDSAEAVNTARYEAITGRVLELQADVEGLRMENRQAQGDFSRLTLQVEGIETQVSRQGSDAQNLQQQLTVLSQNAGELSVQVQTITDQGVGSVTTSTGYTFDENGLRIAKSGQEMENLLDNTGMYVTRGDETILQANAAGVQAVDVTVRNYLVIGSHARFEDYTDGSDTSRTACFFLE